MNWYTQKSDEELQREGLIEEGDYKFEVMKAERKQSKKGNWMIELTLKIWTNEGHERIIFDWLMELSGFRYKTKNFCKSTNLINEYDNGIFDDHHCPGKHGDLNLTIEKDKRDGKLKNRVQDYLEPKEFVKQDFVAKVAESANDDVPF